MKTKVKTKTYTYWVDKNHSTVLGYNPLTNGSWMWNQLDWSRPVFLDDGFDPNWTYMHVWCNPEIPNDKPEDCCRFRVRCKHEIGDKWRAGVVSKVEVIKTQDIGWQWVVTVEVN